MILVVDDDSTMVELLRDLLASDGYEVRTALTAEAAYQHLRDVKCKGVLLDMLMPGINGPQLLMVMAGEGIRMPVILMVDSADFDEAEVKQFPNVRKLLRKPFYPEDVLAYVRAHFERPAVAKKPARA